MPHTLFPNLPDSFPNPTHRSVGPFASVAIERSLDKILDYQIPPALIDSLHIGQRVRVPLGRNNKPALGYVISIQPPPDFTKAKVKPILSIDDARILLPGKMMDLACWMA